MLIKGGFQDLAKKPFMSSLNLSPEQVRSVLLKKINEENKKIKGIKDNSDYSNIKPKSDKFNVVSLFSGAGGLDLGLELAGLGAVVGHNEALNILKSKDKYNKNRSKSIFNIIYSNDNFNAANITYKQNFSKTIIHNDADIRKVVHFPKCQIMVGGFPCPGFSAAGPRLIDDPRNFLYIHFIRALLETQPEFFVAENVKGLLTLAKGEVFRQVVQDFASAGYEIKAQLVNSRDYGVPQLRERVFIIGAHKEKIVNRFNYHYEKPNPTNGTSSDLPPFVTLKDAIGDLEYNPGDYFTGNFSSIYLSRNRKKNWSDQSFTIQASGRQAPLHPSGEPMQKLDKDHWKLIGNNRRLSVKEIARIQTFPDWFKFSQGPKRAVSKNNLLNQQYKQIGNAVPVKLAYEMLLPIAKFLYNNRDKLLNVENLYVR